MTVEPFLVFTWRFNTLIGNGFTDDHLMMTGRHIKGKRQIQFDCPDKESLTTVTLNRDYQ